MKVSLLVKCAAIAAVLLIGSGCSSDGDEVSDITSATLIPEELFNVETGEMLGADGMSVSNFAETRELVTGVTFAPVYFGFDSYQLAPSEAGKIEQVAQYLNMNSSYVVLVDGHCDERGSNEYNLALGEQRAQTIRSYLLNMGINGARVQTRSFGEEKPAAAGRSEDAYRLNRRGEFNIYK